MWDDPIVEEVRLIRENHSKKYNFNLDFIVADLMKSQEKHKKFLVRIVNGQYIFEETNKSTLFEV
jgi:hypothetical protein